MPKTAKFIIENHIRNVCGNSFDPMTSNMISKHHIMHHLSYSEQLCCACFLLFMREMLEKVVAVVIDADPMTSSVLFLGKNE